jgi:hypothetical protein
MSIMELEDKIQHDCVMWFDDKFPQYRGLLYHNYNNPPNKVRGAVLKGMGLRKGVPDLFFALPINGKPGFYIEMKKPKGTLEPEQRKYRDRLKKVGYSWELCRSLEEFKKIITKYLDLPINQ